MDPITIVKSKVAPLDRADVDTDQIIPKQFLKRVERTGFGEFLFFDWKNEDFYILDRPGYEGARILVAGRNFGCGSSREGAVWTMLAVGISCIIARSIADLYRENCLQNGLLPIELPDVAMDDLERRVLSTDGSAPFSVDLRTQIISGPGGPDISFEISEADRTRLLEGLDDIGMSLKHADAVSEWETRARQDTPWLQTLHRAPGTEPSR